MKNGTTNSPSESGTSILVIGSTNVDFIMKIPKLPEMGETITEGVFKQTYGGKGANQAVGAARAGGNVTFVTCLGEDDFADKIVENFEKDHINCDHISKEKGVITGTALVMIDENADNYLSVAPGANYKVSPQIIEKCESAIKEAEMIILQMEIPLETNKYVLNLAAKYGKRVIFNLAPVRPFDESDYAKISILVVNEIEAETLSKKSVTSAMEAENAGQYFLNMGVETVIITLGEKGAYICSSDLSTHIPCFKVNAVDTTAAGDTFCGSLAVALVEGKNLLEAVRFASAASALTVTKLGAQPSIPNRKEINAFMEMRSEPLAV